MSGTLLQWGDFTVNATYLTLALPAGYSEYELVLRNLAPTSASLCGPFGSFLFLQLGSLNPDAASCDGTACQCSDSGHYLFCTAFSTPGLAAPTKRIKRTFVGTRQSCTRKAIVYTGDTPASGWDEEFELSQQDATPTGVSGVVRFYNPSTPGVLKQVQWDLCYFGTDDPPLSMAPPIPGQTGFRNEKGAGVYGLNAADGAAYTSITLAFTGAHGTSYPNPAFPAGEFAGGSYRLWGLL